MSIRIIIRMELKFKGKKKRMGTSSGVLIPISIATLLSKEKEYWFVIKECGIYEKN